MPRSRYKIITEGEYPYFITCSTNNWIPAFSNPHIANIIFDSLRFLQTQNRITLHAYVLMENHLHLIASSYDLSKAIGNFKSYTARQSIDWYQAHNRKWMLEQIHCKGKLHKSDQSYEFWQEGYHPKLVQTDEVLKNKPEYIHNNPIERGYIEDPAHWRYSSYRNYMNMEAPLEIEPLT